MVCGLRSCDTPPAAGNAFSQNMAVLAISMTSQAAIFWKGKVWCIWPTFTLSLSVCTVQYLPHVHPFDVSLNLRPSSAKPPRNGMDSPSISAVVTLNPDLRYNETTPLMDFNIVAYF